MPPFFFAFGISHFLTNAAPCLLNDTTADQTPCRRKAMNGDPILRCFSLILDTWSIERLNERGVMSLWCVLYFAPTDDRHCLSWISFLERLGYSTRYGMTNRCKH